MVTMSNVTMDTDCSPVIPVDSDANEPKLVINIAMGMVALFSICGILGNALAIFVFSRQKQKLSSTIFILTLAVTDFLTSLFTMPYTIIIELLEYNIYYDFLCKLYQFMKTTTIPFSAFVMVAIALDRYLCIVYPFKKAMTIKRAKITVIVLSLFAFALGIMCSLFIGTYKIYQEKEDVQCSDDSNNTYTGIHDAVQNYTELNTTGGPNPGDIVFTGVCGANTIIFDLDFFNTYQKVYSCFFGVCAVLVIVLYTLTYRSVLAQRRKMLHLGNKCCGFLTRSVSEERVESDKALRTSVKQSPNIRNSPNYSVNDENIKLVEQQEFRARSESRASNGADLNVENHKEEGGDKQVRPSGVSRAKLKKLRVANIKTALMLSIVAFIYIVAFTPAWMMALRVLKMNVIVYYLYFIYNVANPVIYAFLNQNFQNQLQALFKCGG